MLHSPVKPTQFNIQIPVRIQIQQQHHDIITMDMKYQTILIWFTLTRNFFENCKSIKTNLILFLCDCKLTNKKKTLFSQ